MAPPCVQKYVQQSGRQGKIPVVARVLGLCVTVQDAGTQGICTDQALIRNARVYLSTSLNISRSVAPHKLALSPLISKTYRTGA